MLMTDWDTDVFLCEGDEGGPGFLYDVLVRVVGMIGGKKVLWTLCYSWTYMDL